MVNTVAGEDRVGAINALAVSEGAELVRRCRAGDGAALGGDRSELFPPHLQSCLPIHLQIR